MLAGVTRRRFLVICGLSAAAIATPLLDLYGRNPEVFVANRTGRWGIILFSFMVAFVFPALCLVILILAKWAGEAAVTNAYRVMVGLLSIMTGLVVSRQLWPDQTAFALMAALGVALPVWLLVSRFETFFVFAGLALPLVLVSFLAASETSGLIWGEFRSPASPSGDIGNPAPVVMIQLDEFPLATIMDQDGKVNEALFPNFARLAEEGTWYRNALSDSIATTQSVPAILTGYHAERGQIPSHTDHPNNLFTLLGSDYDMHVIEWVLNLCPGDVCPEFAGRTPARLSSLLRDAFVVYAHLTLPSTARGKLPSIDNAWTGFLGDVHPAAGPQVAIERLPVPADGARVKWADWLQRLANGMSSDMGPTLSYAHLGAPHVPWVTNPSGTHYQRTGEVLNEVEGVQGDGRWGPNSALALLGFQRHLYQTGFLDAMLGVVFGEMEAKGVWDESMVVVVSDHGASFVPGQHRRWPEENNRDDLYRVPLFIKYPHQTEGEVVDTAAFGIDIVPTIVDALDIETEWVFDGVSLLETHQARSHTPMYWCCNGEGVSTDVSILFDQVDRNHEWIVDQRSWTGIAAVGPHAELVGTPVEDLNLRSSNDLVWSLESGAGLAEADLASGRLQTLLAGRIELPAGHTANDLLFVVNGRVAGVGFVLRDSPGGGSLRGLLAEKMLIDGFNQIDVLIPGEDGRSWVSGGSAPLALEFEAPDGRVLDVQAEGNRRVHVDKVTEIEDGWLVEGWAVDVRKKITPDIVYLYSGDVVVGKGATEMENPNVVRWFDSEDLLKSGFAIEVEQGAVPEDVDYLTVVAEFDGVAVTDLLVLP